MCFVLFFKQKTAYEMRISDWSSDVCSSDLLLKLVLRHHQAGRRCVVLLTGIARCDDCGRIARAINGPQRAERFDRSIGAIAFVMEIGRASCRERVCQYV